MRDRPMARLLLKQAGSGHGFSSRWRLTRYKPPIEEYSRIAERNSLLSGLISRCRKRRAEAVA